MDKDHEDQNDEDVSVDDNVDADENMDENVDDNDYGSYDEDEGKQDEDENLDYLEYGSEDDDTQVKDDKSKEESSKETVSRGSYAAVSTSSFSDMMIQEQILRAIGDCGFEHPSQVQHECIPQALLGLDVVCQAKSGMGKTAVFVISTLQQMDCKENDVSTLVLAHARELAFQICKEFERFSKYLDNCKVAVLFGGIPVRKHIDMLKNDEPQIVVGTPGRIKDLLERDALKVHNLKRFILDECDKLLGNLEMRKDIQAIFKATPREKQVMLFSATISEKMKSTCKKFTKDAMEIYVDDDKELTLYGLRQHYLEVAKDSKADKLMDLLDELEFNQVVIFVSQVKGAERLHKLLKSKAFPTTCIHGRIDMQDRLNIYDRFRNFKERILVSTDLFERGVDIERVNIVINYDMPIDSDSYLHRVGRAGRFGTRGLSITFISNAEDKKKLEEIQARFNRKMTPLPDKIEASSYMQN